QGLTRATKFKVDTGTSLNDGVNSPLQTSNGWTNHVSDTLHTYFFLYDNDGHYSKAKITAMGGVVPAWVEITWYYNKSADDPSF
ncbi:MAG TPA: hypothetical protein VMT35_08950, partial [Ignavibacteriaceae bacterium]|nr:hypothetical protein [Ignavibacteriaceae bacterium]